LPKAGQVQQAPARTIHQMLGVLHMPAIMMQPSPPLLPTSWWRQQRRPLLLLRPPQRLQRPLPQQQRLGSWVPGGAAAWARAAVRGTMRQRLLLVPQPQLLQPVLLLAAQMWIEGLTRTRRRMKGTRRCTMQQRQPPQATTT
jgi:hypothetical protein